MTALSVFTECGTGREPLRNNEQCRDTIVTEQLTSEAASSVREEI